MGNDMLKAKSIFFNSDYTCVVVKGDRIYTSVKRGVDPLLDWIKEDCDFKDACAVDKVVGKAAAFLYECLGIKHLYASIISKPALNVLKRAGIKAEYNLLVDAIINRTKTGLCPMETAVWDIEDMETALDIIKRKKIEMTK